MRAREEGLLFQPPATKMTKYVDLVIEIENSATAYRLIFLGQNPESCKHNFAFPINLFIGLRIS